MQIAGMNDWTVMKPAVQNKDRDLSRFFYGWCPKKCRCYDVHPRFRGRFIEITGARIPGGIHAS